MVGLTNKYIRDKQGNIIGVEDPFAGQSRKPTSFELLTGGSGNNQPTPTPPPTTQPPAPTDIGLFKDPKGNPNGVVLPDGRTFFGLNLDDVNKIVEQQKALKLRQNPEGATELGTQQKLAELSVQQLAELTGLSEEDFTKLTPQEQSQQAEFALSNLLSTSDQTVLGLRGRGEIDSQVLSETGLKLGAGAAALAAVGTGGVAAVPTLAGGVSKAKGLLATFAGLSVASIFQYVTGGKVSDLEGQITDLRTSTRDIVTDVSKGADPIEAIDVLNQIEEEIRWKIGNLNVAIRRSPKDFLTGKDTQDFAFRNLNAIIRRRQAIERYALDGDIDALTRSAGTATEE